MAQAQQTRAGRRRSGKAGSAAGSTRMAWGTMSREQIVDKAVAMLAEQGYDNFTLRRLSDALGMAPMSLYRHVRNKDDLLIDVVDRLLADNWQPVSNSVRDATAWLIEAADRLRAFLFAQPAALHVYLARPVTSPSAIARMEAMLDVLRRIAASEERAQSLYAAMQTYTLGFAALEAARAQGSRHDASTDALGLQLAGYTSPERFVEGLRFLLDGGLSSEQIASR